MSTATPAEVYELHPRRTDPYFYGWRMVERTREDGSTYHEQVPLTERDVLHPREGDFIVHTEAHDQNSIYLKNTFRWRVAGRRGALVLHNHIVDFQVQNLSALGPDVIVLFDSPPWDISRGTYPVRDMGASVQLVVEVTSPSTRNVDLDEKVTAYHRAGVPLYVIVDLRITESGPIIHLFGYRSTPEGPTRVQPDEQNRLWLPPLNLWLAAEGDMVVCLDERGRPLGDYVAVMQAAEEAEARADAEKARADAAQAAAAELQRRNQELEAELRRLRGDQ